MTDQIAIKKTRFFPWIILLTLLWWMGGLINDASATTLPSQADIKTQLEKLNGQSPKDETLIGKYQTLQKQISQSDSLGAERDSYLDIIKQFPQQKTKLQSQIDNAATLAIF